MLAAHIRPWGGVGVRHIPAASPYGVLDTRFAGRAGDNRWNGAGDPTFYIASDRGVALAEFARHFKERQDPALALVAVERALYQLSVEVQALLDLREPAVRAALALHGGARRFESAGALIIPTSLGNRILIETEWAIEPCVCHSGLDHPVPQVGGHQVAAVMAPRRTGANEGLPRLQTNIANGVFTIDGDSGRAQLVSRSGTSVLPP